MKFLASKWTLLGCALLLAVIVTVRWRALTDSCLSIVANTAQKVEMARIGHALNGAGIPIASMSYSPKGGMRLRLEGPQVGSIRCLSGLRVRGLTLHDTTVTDISPLEGPHIDRLDLRGTAVTNLASVARMTHLNELILSRRQVLQNLDLLRGLKVLVGEDDTNSVLPGGIAWSNRYERVSADASSQADGPANERRPRQGQ
jgi:hypothetical protein